MNTLFSRRYYYHLILIAAATLCAILLKRIEPIFLAIPFLCAILLSFFTDAQPRFSISHSISSNRLYEGDVLRVNIGIEAHSDIPTLELLDPLPDMVELLPTNSNLLLTSLKDGEREDFTYQMIVRHRGRFTLGDLKVRAHSLSGMIYREGVIDRRVSYTVYPHVSLIKSSIRPAFTQARVGNYTSKASGSGIEFANIRPYVSGDVVRRINWSQSLRWNGLYVNELLPERNADVVIMIDSLTNVGDRELNTLDLSVRGAASLAYSLIRRKDRVALIDFGGIFRWVPPGLGMRHWYRLMDRLVEAEVNFSYVEKSLASVPKRILPPQSLVIALSPLIDERFITSLSDLAARGFSVVVIIPSPAGVLAQVMKPTRLNETASLLWEMERRFLLDNLRRARIDVIEWGVDEPMEVIAYRVVEWQRKVRGEK